MIYTHDDRLLMTIKELADVFDCSYAYVKNIVDRFDFERYRFKHICKNRPVFIDVNDDFITKVKNYLQVLKTNKADRIIDIINNSPLLSATADEVHCTIK